MSKEADNTMRDWYKFLHEQRLKRERRADRRMIVGTVVLITLLAIVTYLGEVL